MAFNAKSTQSKVAEKLKSLNMRVTFMSGEDETSTYGMWDEIKRSEDTTSTATDSRILMIPGTLKSVPQVGDTVNVKGIDYYVSGVEEVSPTGVSLYYELTVIA